jgi:hypothetical protein
MIAMIKRLRDRLADWRLAIFGHKTGHPPAWFHLQTLAFQLASTEEDDDRALASLRYEIQRQPGSAAQKARERVARQVWCYETDRASRLIDAAIDGTALRAVDAKWVDLFAQEARLGRMPLCDAFPEIISSVPEIGRVTTRFEKSLFDIRTSTKEDDEGFLSRQKLLMKAQREVAQIIGPKSRHLDPLLRSYIPRNIVYRWLRVLCGDPPLPSRDESYFAPAAGHSE